MKSEFKIVRNRASIQAFLKLSLFAILGVVLTGFYSCDLLGNKEDDPEPTPEVITFTPQAITRLCPDHIGGDREFEGHGPDVEASVTIQKVNDIEIVAEIYLHAKETQSDWTEAEGSWDRVIWTAPQGKKIVEIETNNRSETNYRDTNHDLDAPSVRGGNLVDRFEIMGDTGGNDVGNCTSGDVYLSVYFNSIRVKVVDI